MKQLKAFFLRKPILIFGPIGLFLLIASLFTLLKPQASKAAWYDSVWLQRKMLTIDHTKVSGSSNLTSFPVLISITDADLAADAQDDGDDILFTSSDGSTKLDHEIESFNGTTGALVAWVEVPTLSYTADTEIFMYFDSSSATDQQNATGIWDSNYKGVWHLTEDPSGSAPQMLDSTTNNFHGTSNGTMTSGDQVAGQIGGALDMDGNDDYISIPYSSTLNFTTSLTLSAWVYRGNSANSVIFGKPYTTTHASPYFDWLMFINSNALNLRIGSTSNWTGTVPQNAWSYLTLTADGTNHRWYIDGALVSTIASSVVPTNTNSQNIRIGTNASGGEDFLGKIDEIRASSIARSADWTATEYNNQSSPGTFFSAGTAETEPETDSATLGALLPTDSNLVGHWKLDEKSGTTAADSSGNSYSGSLVGNTSWIRGKYGGAAAFDGSGDIISIDNSALNSFGNYSPGTGTTVMAWIKTTATTNQTAVSIGNSGSGTPLFNMTLLTTGVVRYQYRTDNAQELNGGAWDTTVTVNDGQWHHVALRRSANTFEIYVDGILAKTGTSASTYNTLTGNTQTIGAWKNTSISQDFNGQIDDVRFYSDARTRGEIIQDMNAGHPLGGSPIGSQLAYWQFDEQQGLTANSVTGGTTYNGTLAASTATPTWRTSAVCKVNGCLEFDGSNDYLAAPGNEEDQFTIAMWIKPDAVVSRGIAGMAETPGSGTHDRDLYFDANSKLATRIYDGGDKFARTTTTLAADTWYHVGMSYDGTNLSVWLNGKKEASTAASNPYSGYTTPEYIIGRTYTGMGAPDTTITNPFFDGLIDDVQYYAAALTESEMQIVMNANSAINFGTGQVEATQLNDGAGNPPVGYWKFDEKNSTSTVIDSSSNGISGTMVGTMTTADWVRGKIGSALDFDGSDDGINLGTNSLLKFGSGNFTYSAWVKTSATGATDVFVSDSNNATAERMLYTGGANTAVCFSRDASGNGATATGTTTITDGSWHYLSCVRSGTSVYIYVDGRLEGTGTNGSMGSSDTTPTANVYIGMRDNASGLNFTGQIDEVKIFNYARTQAQVAYDYNRGLPIGYWQLDECTGTTAYDASGNGLNGTITIGGTGTYTAAGTCSSGTSTHAWNAGTTGKRNASLGFDGTNDEVSVAHNALLSLDYDWTIMSWIKTTSTATGAIIEKNRWSDRNYQFFINGTAGTGKVSVGYNHGASFYYVPSNQNINDGQWHHVVGTFQDASNTLTLYIDGENASGTPSGTAGEPDTGTGTLSIGSITSGEYFNGLIDDVRVYNYTLSAAQIRAAMNNNAGTRFGPVEGSP